MDSERTIDGRRILRDGRGTVQRWIETTDTPDPRIPPDTRRDKAIGADGRIAVVVLTPPRIIWETVRDPQREMQIVQGEHMFRPLDIRCPSPIHDEVERAISAGYEAIAAELAAKVKLQPRPVAEGFRFSPGAAFASFKPGAMLAEDVLRELVWRHCRGDFGEHGSFDAVELDDDQRFAPVLFGLAVENAVAIEARSGLVKSRYETWRADHGAISGPRQMGVRVEVLTDLAGGRTLLHFRDLHPLPAA